MSFESVYRSKTGATEIEKITNFLMSLVIKNNYEAEAAETTTSFSEYYKYYGAYTRTDDFNDYSLDERRKYERYVYIWMESLTTRTYTMSEPIIKELTNSRISSLVKGYEDKKEIYLDYLQGLRKARILQYDEQNTYYRQFLGLPNTKDDIVFLINYDVSEDGYLEVTNFDELPNPDLYYYYKDLDGKFHFIGLIKTWYIEGDDGTPELRAPNFYYMNTIPAHALDNKLYPKTYAFYILQEHIKELIDKNPDKTYLRFLTDNYTPFYLRNLSNYSIIKYGKNILNPNELNYFFKSYNKAKNQVVLDYIEGFDKKQPLYNLVMIENLLYYTIINYSNTYIEKYTLGIYSEEDLNNILNSNGYSKLTEIKDIDLKRRIVKNLNDLISNKANNDVLELILDRILQDPNAELKRFYIEKQYNPNMDDGSIEIDTSRGLEGSVKLVFREVPAISINELSNSKDVYHDYDKFTLKDNLWGGILPTDSDDTVNLKKKLLKNKILKLNFNSVLTRYITLTRSVDILDAQRKLRDSIYLMLKYFDNHNSPEFFESKIVFKNFECTPAGLFGAMCYLQQMKFYDDPDTIIKDNCIINSSVVFRNMGKVGVDRQSFENTVIIDGVPMTQYNISPEIASWKVIDFIKENPDDFKDFETGVDGERIETIRLKDALTLGKIGADGYKNMDIADESIEDYMTVFRFYSNGVQLGEVTQSTTFADIINDYSHQFPNFLKRITIKLRESYDYREYQAWTYLLNQSRKNNSIYFIFKDCTKFTEFIHMVNSDGLVNFINKNLNPNPSSATNGLKYFMGDICSLLDEITNAFKNWVNTSFSELIYKNNELNDSSASESSYVHDMILLFNEFLSVYSELYSVDYNYTFGNKDFDGLSLQLFYNPMNILFNDKYNDYLNLTYNQFSKFKDRYDDNVPKLDYIYTSMENSSMYDAVNNKITIDEKTKEYIPEDPLSYDLELSFKNYLHYLCELRGELGIAASKEIIDNIRLSDTITITDNYTGDKKSYYA